jgi:hypothetical protein
METIVISIWSGMINLGVISTTNAEFSKEFQVWAELQGYRVDVKKGKFVADDNKSRGSATSR